MTTTSITVRDVTWGVRGRTILDGVSFDCPTGTVTGLLGPNGSGKTSLLHLMAGLRRPTGGTVHVAGQDVHRMPARSRARRISLLEQHASTGLPLTARQVVELGRIPHRGRWPARRDEGAKEIAGAMRLSEVSHLADRSWQTLSGGERQRVQLARALAQRPEVLMLDEPTNHLDLSHQLDLLAAVRDLDLTVVAALHDLDLAAAFCDHLVVLREGHVVADGAPADVLTPRLVDEVYGVEATVGPHAHSGRLHVVWHDRRVR
ncbi:ABC transporter ATP-binding protein [Nocardioides caldifontis]|uniref:ABC transporter ATP-binding protein n=1 Tax=Nocardioides caldifontis TaxID=2588938 RepID=UPI0011DFAF08|nr:ABC transporter ATP-binding protein [Nocardioides caldifontis]